MEKKSANLRKYGKTPFKIVVVHGGPGAPGEMKPVAKKLASNYGVLEPFQTENTVDGQIDELKKVIDDHSTPPVILIGWSWGAWLSYLLAARHPSLVKKLILVGSGPFEARYAKTILATRLKRLSKDDREKVKVILEKLKLGKVEPEIFKDFGLLMDKADTLNPLPKVGEEMEFQPEIYKSVWAEAYELRKNGKLLKAGKNILCPVVAIHGNFDPHPADGVSKPLSRVLKNFRFILLKDCGHTPWKEEKGKDKFYEILRKELD